MKSFLYLKCYTVSNSMNVNIQKSNLLFKFLRRIDLFRGYYQFFTSQLVRRNQRDISQRLYIYRVQAKHQALESTESDDHIWWWWNNLAKVVSWLSVSRLTEFCFYRNTGKKSHFNYKKKIELCIWTTASTSLLTSIFTNDYSLLMIWF